MGGQEIKKAQPLMVTIKLDTTFLGESLVRVGVETSNYKDFRRIKNRITAKVPLSVLKQGFEIEFTPTPEMGRYVRSCYDPFFNPETTPLKDGSIKSFLSKGGKNHE